MMKERGGVTGKELTDNQREQIIPLLFEPFLLRKGGQNGRPIDPVMKRFIDLSHERALERFARAVSFRKRLLAQDEHD